MAFSQWTTAVSGTVTHTLTTSSPLEASSSLQVTATTSGATGVIGLTSGANITTGKIRTLFRLNNVATVWGFGVFGMMQSSILHSSNAYWAALALDTLTTVRLKKTTAGNLDGTAGDLATASHGLTINASTIIALELKWQRDSDSGFVVLNVAMGTATDFSDLATKITYTDNSSPYSTGVSAGLGIARDTSNGDILWDKTQIFRV